MLTLNRLDTPALSQVLARAERLIGRALPLDAAARDVLVDMADGDARYMLGICEDLLTLDEKEQLDPAALAAFALRRAPLYDKGQEEHYNLLSCFHKSLRGSDVDAALYWAARMTNGGEDPAVLFRRLA